MKNPLKKLKGTNFSANHAGLAIVKEYKRERVSHYDIKYVQIDEKLEKRLRSILLQTVEGANTFEEYSFDCPEPEADMVRTLDAGETDFAGVFKDLKKLTPEADIISSVDELIAAKAYMIVLRSAEGIELVGYKRLPENWKMIKQKGLIPLLYRENRFVEQLISSTSNNCFSFFPKKTLNSVLISGRE